MPHDSQINLQDICIRAYSLALYRNNARWRTTLDISRDLLFNLKHLKIPIQTKKQIYGGLNEIFNEVKRWDGKHAQMFPEEQTKAKKRRVSRVDHLRMFHDGFVWKHNGLQLDDYKTAERIISDLCLDWPQLRFQFACCYAITDLLENDRIFDKIRRKVFRQRLGGHCVFEIWLRILDDKRELTRLFQEDRLLVDQLCVQTIHFACSNGFIQLTKYFWSRLNSAQKEAIGFLVWKKVCFQANCPETIRFLCRSLCSFNLPGMLRLTWDNFYFKCCQSLEEDYEKNPQAYVENLRKLQVLLKNWCPKLRNGLIARKDCKVISDAFWYNNSDTFNLLLDYSTKENLKNAREVVDKIYGKKRTGEMFRLRQAVLFKQHTIE